MQAWGFPHFTLHFIEYIINLKQAFQTNNIKWKLYIPATNDNHDFKQRSKFYNKIRAEFLFFIYYHHV